MAKSKGLSSYYNAPPQRYGASGSNATERYRPRTPAETVHDGYTAVVQVTTLNTVTHMSYDSAQTVASHRRNILADNPECEAELNALAFNHIQGLMDIQAQVTDNVKREKQ